MTPDQGRGPVTLGEVARALEGLESRMNLGFEQMNRRLDSLQYVPRGEYEIQINTLQSDIRELADSRRWFGRTMVAAFLFPLLIAVIVALVVTK